MPLSSPLYKYRVGLASGDISDGARIPGFDPHMIFKIRCRTKSSGQRKGARIIYQKTNSEIRVLCFYLKSNTGSITNETVRRALKEMDTMVQR